MASATWSAGLPSAVARALVMPCTATASSGISMPGSASHSRCPTGSPSLTSITAPVTIRASRGSVPVVSRSKPISNCRCQPMLAPLLGGAFPQ